MVAIIWKLQPHKKGSYTMTVVSIEEVKSQSSVVLTTAKNALDAMGAKSAIDATHDEKIGAAVIAFVDAVKVIKAKNLWEGAGFKSFKGFCEEVLPAKTYWTYQTINAWMLAESVPLLREHFGFVGMDNLTACSILLLSLIHI